MKNSKNIKKVNKKGTKKPVEVKEEGFLDKLKDKFSKLLPKKIDSKLVEEAYHDNELWEKGESWAASLANKVAEKISKGKNGNGAIKSAALLNMLEDLEEEKKKAQISEKKFKAIFDNVTVGILGADPQTKKFVFVNKKIQTMLGYTEKELLNMDVSKFILRKICP